MSQDKDFMSKVEQLLKESTPPLTKYIISEGGVRLVVLEDNPHYVSPTLRKLRETVKKWEDKTKE